MIRSKKYLFLHLLLAFHFFACTNGNSPKETVNITESQSALQVSVASGCFIRYERCTNGSCLYGYDYCLCAPFHCLANPNMPPIRWGADNVGVDPVTITRIRTAFVDVLGKVLQADECDLNSFILEPQDSIPLPTPSCSATEEGEPPGADYQPSEIDLRKSLLKVSVFYLDEEGKERESFVSNPLQIVQEN